VLTLKNDSTVWSWGYNSSGALGDSSKTSTITPVKAIGVSGIIAIAGGYRHSLALKADGTVWGWGYNNSGSVGEGSTNNQYKAVQVSGLTNVKAISAGFDYSMALKNDGTVWAWGYNGQGRLGDSTRTTRLLPVKVKVLDSIEFISCGSQCAFAIRKDGTVWSWGSNAYGQAGNGVGIDVLVPKIIPRFAGMKYIRNGNTHTVMINKHDSVFTCGGNSSGQLGIGNKGSQVFPTAVNSLCPLLSYVRVSGKNMDIANGDRTPQVIDNTDFGSVKVSGSKTHIFKLYNKGPETLKINSIVILGNDSANFKVQPLSFPLTIKGGDSLSWIVTFVPLSKGIKASNLRITYNDRVNNIYSFTVKGVATFSGILVRGLNKDILPEDLSPSISDNTSFDRVKKSGMKKNRFIIKNIGTDTLRISKGIISGPDSTVFTFVNFNFVKSLLPSDSTELEIRFLPLDSGVRKAKVHIYSNALDNPVYTYALDGMGIIPVMQISGNNRQISNHDTVPDIADHTDFNKVRKYRIRKNKFTITNMGTDTLLISKVFITGPDSTAFTLGNFNFVKSVLPLDSTELQISFLPLDTHAMKATVHIYSNDLEKSVYTYALGGVGVSPVMQIRGNNRQIDNHDSVPDITDHTDFGTTVKATVIKRSFMVFNTGNDTLLLKNVRVVGPDSAHFISDISKLKTILLPGDSTVLGLTLKADSLGLKKAGILVFSNDTDRQPYIFSVVGIVTKGSGLHEAFIDGTKIYPNPADKILLIDFGTQVSKAKISILANTGQVVLEYTEAGASGICLDTASMLPGLYLLHVEMDNKVVCKAMLISH
jgi:hypothetical protein